MQFSQPSRKELDEVVNLLGPELFVIFQMMSRGEQSHCVRVMKHLQQDYENNHDLLIAALLHDVGKAKYPLHLWERAWIVIGEAFIPKLAISWGADQTDGMDNHHWYQRPFYVSQHHAVWGAELVAREGASPLTVYLIAHHENGSYDLLESDSNELLEKLQIADQMN